MAKRLLRIVLSTVSVILILSLLTLGVLYAGYLSNEYERFTPDKSIMLSDKEFIELIGDGKNLTNEDYEILYTQTGLTKIGVDRVLESGVPYTLLAYRDMYFDDYTLVDNEFFPLMNSVETDNYGKLVPLRDGDVIVCSATYFSFWDIGHSALVTDAEHKMVLEASSMGSKSKLYHAYELEMRPDFLVLRPKIEAEKLAEIVEYANNCLQGLDYDPTVGVLSPKYDENIESSHCSHIIWYAFKHFGYDIDSNGGGIVTPRDIARSDLFEVVQVFGMDPEAFW